MTLHEVFTDSNDQSVLNYGSWMSAEFTLLAEHREREPLDVSAHVSFLGTEKHFLNYDSF